MLSLVFILEYYWTLYMLLFEYHTINYRSTVPILLALCPYFTQYGKYKTTKPPAYGIHRTHVYPLSSCLLKQLVCKGCCTLKYIDHMPVYIFWKCKIQLPLFWCSEAKYHHYQILTRGYNFITNFKYRFFQNETWTVNCRCECIILSL